MHELNLPKEFRLKQPGDPTLKQKVQPLSWDFSPDQLQNYETRLVEFSHKVGAAGMAAPQLVDVPGDMFVITIPNGDGTNYDKAYFGPKILESSENSLFIEGCFSCPQIYLNLKRPATIQVSYLDSDQQFQQEMLSGLLARVFQHEYDHLQGLLITGRASKLKLDLAKSKRKKLQRKHFQELIANSVKQ
jgi:peptide deformylase